MSSGLACTREYEPVSEEPEPVAGLEFKVILGYIAGSRPAWTALDAVSTTTIPTPFVVAPPWAPGLT